MDFKFKRFENFLYPDPEDIVSFNNQLNLMFTALPVLINIGEASTSSLYLWTSSESTVTPALDAWVQFFRGAPFVAPNGAQSETKKDFGLGVTPRVRAIRQVPI
jgi:hypothetical protein